MKNLIKSYTNSYDKPRIIGVTPGFSPDPNEKAQVIVRKNHGVIALRAAFTQKQVDKGKVLWEVGHYLPYEPKLIKRGQFLLPANKVEFWNTILNRMPNFIHKVVTGAVEKYIINR